MSSKTDMIKTYLEEFNKLVPDAWELSNTQERVLIIRMNETPYDVISVIKNHIFFTAPHNWSVTIVFDIEQTDIAILKDIASKYKNINLVFGSKDTPITEIKLPENSLKIYSDTKSFIVKMYDERSPYFVNDTTHIDEKRLFNLLKQSIDDIRSTILSSLSQTTLQCTDECLAKDEGKYRSTNSSIDGCLNVLQQEQTTTLSDLLTRIDVQDQCKF